MSAELGQPGQIIDSKYRIVRLLGTGGMGAVYEGENIRIRRKVAIKMLHGSVSTQPDVIARFEREAQAAALVGSDHICEVLDLGVLADETRYMVMEYLEGDTLSGLIKRNGRLTPPQSIPILTQILDALGAAHAAGIIHRDLKPDNVFILPQKSGIQNFVKILDFGVSKFSQLGGELNVTRAGAVVGTPYYMSPEQARGSSAIDQRTDIYAIGVLLYQATTGQVPYQAETFNELLFKIVLEVAPPPQTYVPDIDPDFASIIQCAMAREPDQRFQSCQQFRDALLQFQRSRDARASALPAYNLPGFHDGGSRPQTPYPPVTQSGAAWGTPNPAGFAHADGTMPMSPGLVLGGGVPGLPFTAGPPVTQSGAAWGAASSAGAPPVQAANTENSWGNASSPANTQAGVAAKPASNKGLLVGLVGATAVLGIVAAVGAVVMMGHGPRGPGPAAGTQASAIASVPPVSVSASVAPPAAESVPVLTAAEPTPSGPTPSGVASAEAPKLAATARVAGPMPGHDGAGATNKGGNAKRPGTKGATKSGGDLGY